MPRRERNGSERGARGQRQWMRRGGKGEGLWSPQRTDGTAGLRGERRRQRGFGAEGAEENL